MTRGLFHETENLWTLLSQHVDSIVSVETGVEGGPVYLKMVFHQLDSEGLRACQYEWSIAGSQLVTVDEVKNSGNASFALVFVKTCQVCCQLLSS